MLWQTQCASSSNVNRIGTHYKRKDRVNTGVQPTATNGVGCGLGELASGNRFQFNEGGAAADAER
jgi:hypothetical protein